MARFRCTCGAQVRTSGDIPNPAEWHLIADRDFDVEADPDTLLGRSVLAWRCANCGRLWLDDGRVEDAKSPRLWEYVPNFSDGPGPLA
ncbi:hypothetical protein [Actinophytocola sp.]|uniref:hypothetical protein n=1 Tax=Actinophytocola sp. TaxID=1872138 RepID=UPI002ED482BC